MFRFPPIRILVFLLFLLAAATDAQAADAEVERLRFDLDAVRLDLGAARPVDSLAIDLTVATLRIDSGTLVPTTPVAGQVREWLFVGDGLLVVDPPDAIERQQLELYTGEESLRERITEAVLVLARDDAIRALAERPTTPASADTAAAATALFERWRASGERRMLRADDALLLDILGDPLYATYFGGFFHGESQGDFLIVIEPDAFEQVTVGRFEPMDLGKRERRRTEKAIAKAQRRGRWIGVEVERLGAFETWMSMPLRDADGGLHHGRTGFDVEHYDLDLTIQPRGLDLAGVARIDLTSDGSRRAVRLTLSNELAVQRVTDDASAPLDFEQAAGELLIILPSLPEAGETVRLEIAYTGDLIEQIPGTRARLLVDTQGWYPRTEVTDTATYAMLFRWPKKLELFAGGVPGEHGVDGDLRWQRYRVDRPVSFTTFEVGTYKVETRRTGHVDIRIALDPSARMLFTGKDRDEVLDSVGDALSYFESIFGPYPYDHLTVVTAPRSLSQASPGMITISSLALADEDGFHTFSTRKTDPRAILAHEIAHQWWGHIVGWQSYRDQWISEAVANYAALLYMRNRLETRVDGPTHGWQRSLVSVTEDGRPIESMGPLVLGARLGAGPAPRAYGAIVYQKGAVVLDMLARRFGEETFIRILQRMIEAVPGRALSTGDFLHLIERMTDVDLGPFADQFIYGTGLPEVYYDLRFAALDDGRWEVTGTARQEPPYRYVYRVAADQEGRFDVRRERVDQVDVEASSLIVPVMISVFDPAKEGGAEDARSTGNTVALYHTRLTGRSTDLRVELEHEPKVVMLDPRREVFARFFDRRRYPKQVLLFEGLDLAAAGRYEEAEARLEEAWNAPVRTGPTVGAEVSEESVEIAGLRLDARIGRALARLYLDQRHTQSADTALERAEAARADAERLADRWQFASKPSSVVLLEARLTLQKGDAERAYKALLRAMRKDRWRIGGREAQALLAVAAHATGEEKIMREALDEARELGVDVRALDPDGAAATGS